MTERAEHARRQALLAREKALQCGHEPTRQDWLRVADLWEAIAHEYGELAKASESIGGSTVA